MSLEASQSQAISLDDEVLSGVVTLTSKDGSVSLSVDKSYTKIFKVIASMLEDDKEATEIPLEVSGPILTAIVNYMNLCKGVEMPEIDKPLRSKDMSQNTTNENAQFIEDFCSLHKENKMLYDLIGAANYLQGDSLLQLGAAKVAAMVKGIPLEEIKEVLK